MCDTLTGQGARAHSNLVSLILRSSKSREAITASRLLWNEVDGWVKFQETRHLMKLGCGACS